MSAALYVIAYALYAMCLVWTVCVSGDVLLDSCGGNTHNLVCGSRVDKHRKPLCYHRGDSIEVFCAYQHENHKQDCGYCHRKNPTRHHQM